MTGRVVLDGLRLPECPRWHDGALWLSDMWAHEVLRIEPGGAAAVVHRFDEGEDPGGIGWLPDGSLLVVGMEGRVIWRVGPDGVAVHADLGHLAAGPLNDMVVAADGTAYVSQFGYDMWGGAPLTETVLIRVGPDGDAAVVAEGMASPNGMALTPDGSVLVVAEPGAGRLSRFRVTADGVADRDLLVLDKASGATHVTPDGICLDEAGAIWFADPLGHRVVRLTTHGVGREIALPGTHPLACVLGGPDRRTLFVCTTDQVFKPTRTTEATGTVLAFDDIDVPGAGRP